MEWYGILLSSLVREMKGELPKYRDMLKQCIAFLLNSKEGKIVKVGRNVLSMLLNSLTTVSLNKMRSHSDTAWNK